jgi:general secretion pathway protein L
MVYVLRQCLSRFLRWWIGELAGCLPSRLQTALRFNGRKLVLVMNDDDVVFEHHQGKKPRKIGQLSLTKSDPDELRKSANRIARREKLRSAPVVLQLLRCKVLQRSINLPLAAAENLREVLGFEMDRFTPFKGEEVYYDYRIAKTDPELKRINVDLAVVPKPVADEALSIVRAWKFEPVQVGLAMASDGEGAPSFNFLPAPARKDVSKLRSRFAIVLMFIFLGLSAAAIFQPLHQKQEALAAEQAELMNVRAAALHVDQLENQLTERLDRSQYTVAEKHNGRTGTELLNEISRLLPDHTWVVQFSWHEGGVSLSGYSKEPSALIGLLEQSEMLDSVRFNSPVTLDQRLGLHRFNLAASVLGRGI